MDLGAFEMELAGCLAAWGGALMLVLGVHQPEHRKKHHGKFGIYYGMVWYIPAARAKEKKRKKDVVPAKLVPLRWGKPSTLLGIRNRYGRCTNKQKNHAMVTCTLAC